jgi:hypothetical protein
MSAAYPATQEKSSSSKDFVRQLTLGRGIANSNMIPFQEDIKRLVRENSEWAILGDFLDDGAYYEIPEPEKQRAEKEPSEPVPKKETREEMVARETREIARAKSHIDFQKSLDEQWKIRYTNWVSQISKTDQAKRTLWMFIMSRIDENTKELLKADDSWRTIDKERSPLTLMKLIEKIHLQPRPGVEVRDSFLGLEHLMETKMFPTESLAAFAKRFQNRVEHTKRLNAPQFDEKLLAYMFLARLDNTRYSQVRLHLDHKADSGIKYPETIQAMQLSVARWEETQAASSAPKASFVVTGATPEDPPNDSPNRQKRGGKGNGQGKEKKRLKEEGEKYCHFCQLSSHSTTDCRKMAKAKRDFGQGKGGGGGGEKGGEKGKKPFRKPQKKGEKPTHTTHFLFSDRNEDDPYTQSVFMVESDEKPPHLEDWDILLDSGASFSMVRNPNLLKNIRNRKTDLRWGGAVDTGSKICNQIGDLFDLGEVNHSTEIKANILCFGAFAKNEKFDVQYHKIGGSIPGTDYYSLTNLESKISRNFVRKGNYFVYDARNELKFPAKSTPKLGRRATGDLVLQTTQNPVKKARLTQRKLKNCPRVPKNPSVGSDVSTPPGPSIGTERRPSKRPKIRSLAARKALTVSPPQVDSPIEGGGGEPPDDPPGPQGTIPSIRTNASSFTKREQEKAGDVQEALRRLGHPSVATLIKQVKGAMKGIPFSPTDIYNSVKIYGPDIASLKGKTGKKKSIRFEGPDEATDEEVVPQQQDLHIDVFFVEKINFLVSVSSPMAYLTTTALPSRNLECMKQALLSHINGYTGRKFKIRTVRCDGEASIVALKSVIEERGIVLDLAGPAQHVPQVEVMIRVIKQRARSILNTLTYDLPLTWIPYLIQFVTHRINLEPKVTKSDNIGGGHPHYGPRNVSQ